SSKAAGFSGWIAPEHERAPRLTKRGADTCCIQRRCRAAHLRASPGFDAFVSRASVRPCRHVRVALAVSRDRARSSSLREVMSENVKLPVLPMRGAVIYPGPAVSVAVSRAGTSRAVDEALAGDRRVFVVAQRENEEHVSK